MKLLVIGHSVEDHLHKGEVKIVKPGGIYYTVLGLLRIIEPQVKVSLITSLEKDNYHLFADEFDKVNLDYTNWVDEIPKVHLFVHETEERTECYEKIPQNLKIDYDSLQYYDGILINMVTGYDISLEQMKKIREHFKGLIYFDVHTLSRGFDQSKMRMFRKIDNFDKWASALDIIQANEIEVETLLGLKDELKTATEVLHYGIKYLIVTKGEAGARVYFKRKNEIESVFVSSDKYEVLNKVGCGDIFGSVLFYSYLKSKNITESLFKATKLASKSVSMENISELSF
jgi:sugar/nucleoside kinase (ribokinase family)